MLDKYVKDLEMKIILANHYHLDLGRDENILKFIDKKSKGIVYEIDENDIDIIDMIHDKKSIILLNKSDLATVITKDMLKSYIDKPMIEISAKEERGIEELEEILKNMFFDGKISFNDEVYITNIRHKTALQNAYESLKKVIFSIENDMPEDFYSIDLLDAYESLGSITGETIGEDLVNEIFSKFCMGK